MNLRKYRWSKHFESAEEELVAHLAARHIDAERWAADSNEDFAPHTHPQNKTLWCADGSIIFTVDGKIISLQPGDTLEIPAGTVHGGTAGLFGCVCYESPATGENPFLPA
jgi:quercetin dioxygenase-like cupin family protein